MLIPQLQVVELGRVINLIGGLIPQHQGAEIGVGSEANRRIGTSVINEQAVACSDRSWLIISGWQVQS